MDHRERLVELTDLVGEEIAGFKLVSILGEGAMAVVFRGENALDTRIVRAIKVIRPELSGNPEFVRRFAEEARLLESFQHSHIVRFHGVRKERGYLVMELELLEGATLGALIAKAESGLGLAVTKKWFAEAATAVGAAHARGVIHRDLKPDNLFITKDGLKVLDFGITRALDDADRAAKLTAVGSTLGTPAYMVPEVCNGAIPAAAADVYALGITFYEAFAGAHPFQPKGAAAKSTTQMMFAHVSAEIPPLARVRADVPADVVAVVMTAVARDTRVRYKDAGELEAALRGVKPAVARASAKSSTFRISRSQTKRCL